MFGTDYFTASRVLAASAVLFAACLTHGIGPACAQSEMTHFVSEGVSGGVLNLRAAPGVTSTLIASVPAGQGVRSLGQCERVGGSGASTTWCRFSWNGQTGWLASNGLRTAAAVNQTAASRTSGWRIAPFSPNSTTGRADGCVATRSATDKVAFSLALNQAGGWNAGLQRTVGFGTPVGGSMMVSLYANGHAIYNGRFVVAQPNFGYFQDGMSAGAVRAIEASGVVELATARERVTYDLAGAKLAVVELEQCVAALDKAAARPLPKERTSTGTGFYVSTGHLLTNAHVVDGCEAVSISMPGGAAQSVGTVIARDAVSDLALVRSQSMAVDVSSTLRRQVRLGEDVWVFGYPLHNYVASSGNFTRGNVTALAGMQDDSTRLQITAPIQPGNSGGPVLDQFGNVVGVVVSKINPFLIARETGQIPEQINFAIKADTAATFLQSNNVGYTGATKSSLPLSPPDLADLAKRFTVFVVCRSVK